MPSRGRGRYLTALIHHVLAGLAFIVGSERLNELALVGIVMRIHRRKDGQCHENLVSSRR